MKLAQDRGSKFCYPAKLYSQKTGADKNPEQSILNLQDLTQQEVDIPKKSIYNRNDRSKTFQLKRGDTMSFSETIKTLRRSANMTQEQLAELLSISPQAVSRWETGAAMPDISLLPPLANLFGVSTDHLLGMDSYQKDLRKAAFDEAFFEYWKHDDKEKNYQIALQAASEYPGNMDYIEWLASAEYYVAFQRKDHSEYEKLLESSAAHYKVVLDHSQDARLISKALHGIVLSLCMLNRKDEAKEYALRIEDQVCRDDAVCWCLEGEERIRHCQSVSERYLNRFLFQLTFSSKTLEAYDAAEKILAVLFPDGNYQYYHNTLEYNALSKAQLLCREARYDEATEELRRAKYHAKRMDQYDKQNGYRFTAPLFDHVAGEKPPTDAKKTNLDAFYESLENNACFDTVRDREEVKALYQQR